MPSESNTLCWEERSGIPALQDEIQEIMDGSLLPYIIGLSNIKKVVKALQSDGRVLLLYPLAICFFQLKESEKGYDALQRLVVEYPNLSPRYLENANTLRSLQEKEIDEKLEQYKKENIRRLHLSKLLD